MAVGRGDEARSHVVAKEHDGGGMAAVASCQRAAGVGAVLGIGERRLGAGDVRQVEAVSPLACAEDPPTGRDWLHEIKHDGFRIMARRDGDRVRLLTRNGNDFSRRFPQAAAAVAALPARSCLIDGEAIVTDQKRLAVFDLIRGHQSSAAAFLCAFDLLELNGEDFRRGSIETRRSTLKSLLRGKHAGITFNAHFIADCAIVYRQACALGCEGIVSKRLGSPYRSGRADCWVKVKNPATPAVTREAAGHEYVKTIDPQDVNDIVNAYLIAKCDDSGSVVSYP
jgi:bifunctional non-homologous end joining protein LigD